MKEEQNGNWDLGDVQPRTMDSSQRGAGLLQRNCSSSCAQGKMKWNPKLKRGKEILFARGHWGKGEKLPEGNGSNLEC